MSKARELANLGNAYSDGALSNRNLIINGAMQVWQRGTSFSGYNNYSADRWRVSVSAVPTSNTVDRVQEGNKNYARWQCTMPSGHLAFFHQRIEGNPLAGKTVTVSFSAKGSGTLYEISLDQITGGVNAKIVAATNVVLSATEERYNFTVQLPSIASVPLATDQTRVQFFCSGSISPVDMYITEVQLEVGDTATPFEHRSYGQELALCQRYFFKTYAQGTAIGTATTVNCSFLPMHASNSYARIPLNFPVSMRTTPTFVSYNTNNGASGQVSGDSSNYTASPASLGPDRVANGVSNILLGQHVYLTWHCTADAEL